MRASYVQPTTSSVVTNTDAAGKVTTTTVTIPTGPSLAEVLSQTEAKYLGIYRQCQKDSQTALDSFLDTYKDLVKDLSSPITGGGGNPDVILVRTDTGGKFEVTVPGTGRYYVVVLNPLSPRRKSVKQYVVITADITPKTAELTIASTDFVLDK